MNVAIAKEHTLFGAELEFVGVERMEIGPARTMKSVRDTIVQFLLKKHSNGEDDWRTLDGSRLMR
jgi:hypothetical protein